ncbi:30S ribosomal protein S20 [Thermomicrobium sp. 4228-Ro]|uniref:30S ribosomal protein S20 n=1 Tax=Thermomicrobium sp. 4228-Ro TaxID=2993937 RepID=UPI00224892EB|nr:30S ribosomal protein S20 [Thermomicrobium sp. 4228-Ro]MCX2726069.1 30S ribosomal protein S20 [Thermomicrobium sp. 4228-Ro]
MPNTKSAAKALRRSERRRIRNRYWRSTARTLIKKARKLIEAGDLEAAAKAVGDAISVLDRAAAKGVIHKNNAARRKSRLMKRFNALLKARLAQQAEQQGA